MRASYLHLTVDIPALGAEFRVGQNCSKIERFEGGWLVRSPKSFPTGVVYPRDILVCSGHWLELERDDTPRHVCEVCGVECATANALGGHRFHKHGIRRETA